MSSKNKEPTKADWLIGVGFIIFMVAMIGAVFGQNLRWLGAAFILMTIVIGFGLFNNIKNRQPNWGRADDDIEIYVPDAPDSLQKAIAPSGANHHSKRAYWTSIIIFAAGSILFFVLGLFLLFSDLGSGF
ncbi:MAG: hypothetical protein AAF902_03765 [Chloroflexota bacterium]